MGRRVSSMREIFHGSSQGAMVTHRAASARTDRLSAANAWSVRGACYLQTYPIDRP